MPGASGNCCAIYIWIPEVLGRWCFNLGIFAAAQWIQTESVPQLWSGGYPFLCEGTYIHILVTFSGKLAQYQANNFVGHYIAHNMADISSPCRTTYPLETLLFFLWLHAVGKSQHQWPLFSRCQQLEIMKPPSIRAAPQDGGVLFARQLYTERFLVCNHKTQ